MAHILLTNDDGIQAPGLRALLPAIEPLAQVTVFAPDHNWSAAGHTKTMHKPLRADRYTFEPADPNHGRENSRPPSPTASTQAYTTTGAPSDCVALVLLGISLLDKSRPPDLVVSGINQGANVGHDLTYSGTVAAAMEAAIFGLPAVAISLDSYESHDFSFAAQAAARIVREVQVRGLPPGTFLNVNIPCRPAEEVRGIAITRLGRRVYRDILIERTDPRGRPYYWIGGEPPAGYLDQGTDIWALANGFVSITPIQLDMTAESLMAELCTWKFE